MINATFGKSLENVRKRVDFELVNTAERFQKLVNDPMFDGGIPININDNLCGVTRKRENITLDKPITVGFSILDISKVLMYDFH